MWREILAPIVLAVAITAPIAAGAVMQPARTVEPRPVAVAAGPACAVELRPYEWHDLDTAQGVLRLPYGVSLDASRGVRAIGYDGWEIGSRAGAGVTDEERRRGRAGLEALRRLSDGCELWAEPIGGGRYDSFGRPLAALWLRRPATGEWIELRAWATAGGHVRR
jgi:hypothetical protein